MNKEWFEKEIQEMFGELVRENEAKIAALKDDIKRYKVEYELLSREKEQLLIRLKKKENAVSPFQHLALKNIHLAEEGIKQYIEVLAADLKGKVEKRGQDETGVSFAIKLGEVVAPAIEVAAMGLQAEASPSTSFWDEIDAYLHYAKPPIRTVPQQVQDPPPVSMPSPIQPVSPKVEWEQEVHRSRRKFMLGKWVGEDLLDEQGGVMIPKNTVITEEVIHRAEQAGKLAELIISMKLPEAKE
jgi:hypothetical protein